jgi:hypothetical protein
MGPVNIVLRADGSTVQLGEKPSIDEVCKLIGADALDGFRTHDGRYVYIDGIGHMRRGPVRNEAATALYHSICYPGTTHFIVGDAVVIAEESPL